MLSIRTRVPLVALAAAAALTTAACGSTKAKAPSSGNGAGASTSAAAASLPADGEAAFATALAALGSGSSVTAKLSIGASTSDLAVLGEVTSDGSDDSSSNSADEKLGLEALGGNITFAVTSTDGSPLDKAGTKTSSDVTVNGASGTLFETKTIAGVLYVRAAVPKILSLSGTPSSALAPAHKLAQNPKLAFIDNALAGDWLKLDLGALSGLARQGGATPGLAGDLGAKVIAALRGDVTVERGATNGDETDLTLSAPVKKVATDLVGVARTVPQLGAALSQVDLSKVPERTVKIDAKVKGSSLSQISIDIFQFFPAKDQPTLSGHHFPIQLDFSQAPVTVTAPATSTPVDLPSLIGAALSGGLKPTA
ncbi:MAG TPA: hypothetical protein VHE83_04885 [Mycobacteriales bacterium]|nr:hypothetical protein [Mycobacteriales bacterium]